MNLEYQVHTSSDISLLPVAKAIYVDFRSYDRMGWEMTTTGIALPIPYAIAANIETPTGFPDIPERWDVKVQESAEGLYEVANVLELYLDEEHPAQKPYRDALRRMRRSLHALYDSDRRIDLNRESKDSGCDIDESAEKRMSVIHICEDTNYELETLIGLIQVFVGTSFLHEQGVERIGVFLTFRHYTFVHNYNLNLQMAKWLRDNWTLPYADMNEVNRLSYKYGFEPRAIQSWIRNAITIVWNPVLTGSGPLREYLGTLLLENRKSAMMIRGCH